MFDRVSETLGNLVLELKAAAMGSKVIAKGRYELVLLDQDGNVKSRRKGRNLIVTNGKNGIADQCVASPSITKPTHMAIGTGTTAPAAGDTTLQTENCTRQSCAPSRSGNVLTFTATFGAGNGTGAVTEAGILSASTGGNLYSRITFSAINKGASDSLQLTWTWTIG